ncbi:RNG2 [Hepatospora eriocheir]|uniref:RNG2 n=1 Tax=Hepatospora eriocheir TaxID=1081669 RepID=A0A1X0QIM5_9MICR|nr:RNG2 [Hepatospora eriocheir]
MTETRQDEFMTGNVNMEELEADLIKSGNFVTGLTEEEILRRIKATKKYYNLIRLEGAKEWINREYCEVKSVREFKDQLRTGILLAEIANKNGYKCKVYRENTAKYYEIENINNFLRFLKTTKLPSCYHFETLDLWEYKNESKVIACLYALAKLLSNEGKSEGIKAVNEKEVCFTKDDLEAADCGEIDLEEIQRGLEEVRKDFNEEKEVSEEKEIYIEKPDLNLDLIPSTVKSLIWRKAFKDLFIEKNINLSSIRKYFKSINYEYKSHGITYAVIDLIKNNQILENLISESYKVIRLLARNVNKRNIEEVGIFIHKSNNYDFLKRILFLLIGNYPLLISLINISNFMILELIFPNNNIGNFSFKKFLEFYKTVDYNKALEVAKHHFNNNSYVNLPEYFELFNIEDFNCDLEMETSKFKLNDTKYILQISINKINKIIKLLKENIKYCKGELKALVNEIGFFDKKLEGSNLTVKFENKKNLLEDTGIDYSYYDSEFNLDVEDFHLDTELLEQLGKKMYLNEVKNKLIKLIVDSNEEDDLIELLFKNDEHNKLKAEVKEDLNLLESLNITKRSNDYNEMLHYIVETINDDNTYMEMNEIIAKNKKLLTKYENLKDYLNCYAKNVVTNKSGFFNRTVEPKSKYGTYKYPISRFDPKFHTNVDISQFSLKISSNEPLIYKCDLIFDSTVVQACSVNLCELLVSFENNNSSLNMFEICSINVSHLIDIINKQYIID